MYMSESFLQRSQKADERAGILIVQTLEPEKALSGCCPGISAAVAVLELAGS